MHRPTSQRMIARTIVALMVATLVGVGATSTGASAAPTSTAVRGDAPVWGVAEEQAFVVRINQLRASVGVPQLSVDAGLTAAARSWAESMKEAGAISHAPDITTGAPPNWIKVGENVGVGPTVDALFTAFVNSPHHYANLVDPSFRYVGVGVVWSGNVMYTTHRFMAVAPTAPPPAPPTPVHATTVRATAPKPKVKAKATARPRPKRRTPATTRAKVKARVKARVKASSRRTSPGHR